MGPRLYIFQGSVPTAALAAAIVICLMAGRAIAEDAAPPARFGPAALDEARRSGRPLLVVVRDPACARCLLDEEEALAEPRAARLLQSAFVVARVDRVERPDLDALFATAVEWLSGERGYPLALALLPDGRPYAGRAGVGAEDRGQTPGLHRFALRAWSDFTHARPEAESRAAAAARALGRAQELEAPASPAGPPSAAALRGLQDAFDPRLGGFGAGEAFAPPAALRLLLAVLEQGEDASVRRMLVRTLDAVAAAEPEPATLARRALLLEAFARATRLSDSPVYRARAAALADGALGLREADGAFRAYGEEGGAAPVVAGWNGLMIGALALSGSALDRPQDLAAARSAANAVLQRLGPPPRLRRMSGAPAPLEDHALLAEGLLRLHAALGGREPRWAAEAAALVDGALGRYLDPSGGGFFDAIAGADAFIPPALPQKLRSGFDGGLPSANGVMAGVLARLARDAAQPRYGELAQRTVDAFAAALARAPRGMEGLAASALESRPAAGPGEQPEAAVPAGEVRDGIAFAAEVARDAQRPRDGLLLRVRVTVPPGRYVVAHDAGAADLLGLSVSVPTAEVALAGPVRFPPAQRLAGRWGSGTVLVYTGRAVAEAALRLAAGAPPAAVRVRIVFQACRDQAATCERPQTVLLEAALAPAH